MAKKQSYISEQTPTTTIEKILLSVGNIVSTTSHDHRMTIHDISSNDKAKCQYFVEDKLHEETHLLKDLTFIAH